MTSLKIQDSGVPNQISERTPFNNAVRIRASNARNLLKTGKINNMTSKQSKDFN